MTGQEYAAWVQHHSELFVMTSEADIALFARWKPLLIGYDLADCIEASNWIACNAAARYRSQHCDLIHDRVRIARQARFRAYLNDQAGRGEPDCEWCHGSGWLSVPHPRYVLDGVWQRYGRSWPTLVVPCNCVRGRARTQVVLEIRTQTEGRVSGMTLEEYEMRVPHWAELLLQRDNAAKDDQVAREAAEWADSTGRPIDPAEVAKRLAEKFREKR